MKQNSSTRSAMAYLISGLLLTISGSIISRYFLVPDSVKGFMTGLGLMLEVIALVKLQRSRKDHKCRASNSEA
jgi:hypothetical protein